MAALPSDLHCISLSTPLPHPCSTGTRADSTERWRQAGKVQWRRFQAGSSTRRRRRR
ncbi:uncharacterized protein DS421_20g695870 [Arachis hypogaea]|nr:uncharacterized protein DS421_20g695870 [Arachis hypogaea]